ncbi:MAG: rRNA maturation RNase YbeY [Leptospira sp.]|nr:rRNA maturation RNase YbeY [Leptospira sp.]
MNSNLQIGIHWNSEVDFPEISIPKAEKNLEKVIQFISPDFLFGTEVSILLTNDEQMEQINFERRGKKKTTDVLSFPIFNPEDRLPFQILGEIVISVDLCRIQAEEIGHSILDEFYRLLVHGILHLFGYDHESNEEDAILMRKKEDDCLELIFS